MGNTFEQRRKTRGDKKKPWLGGKVNCMPLIHAPDNWGIAYDPINMSHPLEERFVFLDDLSVDDAKLILAIHCYQIDGTKRIAGDVCINRAQALFKDSRTPVQKGQNQLSINRRRSVQQKWGSWRSRFGRSLGSHSIRGFRFFSRPVRRLRQKQVGNVLQSSSKPLFRTAVLLKGGLCNFLSLQVQVIETKRSSAKIC